MQLTPLLPSNVFLPPTPDYAPALLSNAGPYGMHEIKTMPWALWAGDQLGDARGYATDELAIAAMSALSDASDGAAAVIAGSDGRRYGARVTAYRGHASPVSLQDIVGRLSQFDGVRWGSPTLVALVEGKRISRFPRLGRQA